MKPTNEMSNRLAEYSPGQSPEASDIAKRISDIKARAEAATPGPWEYKTYAPEWDDDEASYDWYVQAGYIRIASHENTDHRNGKFIAHAREDIPWLLDQVVQLSEQVETLQKQLNPPITSAFAVQALLAEERRVDYLTKARAVVDAARKIDKVLNDQQHAYRCEHLHHRKSDLHEGSDCPVEARIETEIDSLSKALQEYDCLVNTRPSPPSEEDT